MVWALEGRNINCGMNSYYLIGTVYSCDLEITFIRGETTLYTLYSYHIEGKNTSDIQRLNIYDQKLNFIPRSIGYFYPNLLAISFYLCSLVSVSNFDLKQLLKAIHIEFTNNLLEHIPGDLFLFNPKLQDVDFSRNRIKSVGKGILQPVEELHTIHFISNICINGRVLTNKDALQDFQKQLEEKCPTSEMVTDKIFTDVKGQITRLDTKIDNIEKRVFQAISEHKQETNTSLENFTGIAYQLESSIIELGENLTSQYNDLRADIIFIQDKTKLVNIDVQNLRMELYSTNKNVEDLRTKITDLEDRIDSLSIPEI